MYSVGIIGLGNIASGYGGTEEKAPYTHAGGIKQSDAVRLTAVADISAEARATFRDKWGTCFPGVREFDGIGAMLQAGVPDIVAVCTRGPHHHAALMEVLAARPRAVFLEKPPTCSLAEMDEVCQAARAAGTSITVSYSRHWGPHVLRMAELVKGGLIGEVRSVVGYCGGSFLSFSSHVSDLICQFAGYCPTAVFARGVVPQGPVPDGYEPEPSIRSALIEFANGVLGTHVGHDGHHGSFTCDVIGSEGRATVPFYGTPFAKDRKGNAIDLDALGMPDEASPFKMAYEQIAAHLDGGPLPDCTDQDFVAVHELCFGGIESVLTDQRVVLPNVNRSRRVYANG